MELHRGGYTFTSVGRVAVAPSSPFEWYGFDAVQFYGSEKKDLSSNMEFADIKLIPRSDDNINTSIDFYGTDFDPESLDGYIFNVNLDVGGISIAYLSYDGDVFPGGASYSLRIEYPIQLIQEATTLTISTYYGEWTAQFNHITIQ